MFLFFSDVLRRGDAVSKVGQYALQQCGSGALYTFLAINDWSDCSDNFVQLVGSGIVR